MDVKRKPDWLKIKLETGANKQQVETLLKKLELNTVCEEANCPNQMECFNRRTATFMILGKYCTRHCTFCNVTKQIPLPPDETEPKKVAAAVRELNLKFTVITSVTRDDLPDGGAGHFAAVIQQTRAGNPDVLIEVLIPDFQGGSEALAIVVNAAPDVLNHNVETVPRLYPEVRPQAVYERSLRLLEKVKEMNPQMHTKSGIMVGLGEKYSEVLEVFNDLRNAGCDFLTVGQYLAPSKAHHPVVEYIHPDIFADYREKALKMGFKAVASGPLVRSSYHAEQNLVP